MKKAFFQVLVLLVFANGVMMISLMNPTIPEEYQLGKALIIEDYLVINIGEKVLTTRDYITRMYFSLEVGDSVDLIYKLNESRTVILDAKIIDWYRVPFSFDKIVLELLASLFLFGLLVRNERQKLNA